MKKTNAKTYHRLLRKMAQQMANLKPDTDEMQYARMNRKFQKYLAKAGIDLKNGPTGNTNN